VGARFGYWEAALKTAASNPWTGTGPGTFMIPYREIKRPESEMTRMVHNDYLEQASDSGWIGFLTYAGFITAGVFVSGRRCFPRSGLQPSNGESPGWTDLCLWLGLLGWCLQGLFEFGLYIPALAWPAFAFLGLLLGRGPNRIDKHSPRL
jgi:O-antigen ligase